MTQAQTEWVYVLYDGEVVWHQHLNLGRVALSASDNVIFTADGDMYIVTLLDNRDVVAIRFGGFAAPPVGLRANQIYRFREEPSVQEKAQLRLEAEQVAQLECRRRAEGLNQMHLLANLRPLVVPGAVGGALVPPRGPAVGALRGAAAPPGAQPAADEAAGTWQ